MTASVAAAFQPDPVLLRRLFEDNLARRQHEFGDTDPRTAQAARDLGHFLQRASDLPAARRALAEAVRIDDKALGPTAPATLEDVADLAAISPAARAAPLFARAAESPDPTVAGPALSSLAALRKSAGDRTGAAALLRRAVTKAEAIEGPNGQTVALVLNALAAVTPTEEAIAALERALAIDARLLGPRGARTLQDARSLAALLRAAGRSADAAVLERQYPSAASH